MRLDRLHIFCTFMGNRQWRGKTCFFLSDQTENGKEVKFGTECIMDTEQEGRQYNHDYRFRQVGANVETPSQWF